MKTGDNGVLMVIFIAKFFILFLDVILYILPSLMYITTCYSKHKNQLKYLYFSILVFSPITWVYDYTHIDWSCIRAGMYMLSLIMLHTQEFEMSVCFTSFMINIDHKSFYYIVPLLVFSICNVIHKNKVLFFGSTLFMNAVLDVAKLLSCFLIPFITMWLPWVAHPREFMDSVIRIFWNNTGHHNVNMHSNIWHIFEINNEYVPMIVYTCILIPYLNMFSRSLKNTSLFRTGIFSLSMYHALFASPVLNTITIPTIILITSIKEFRAFASEFIMLGTISLFINNFHATFITNTL